MVQIPEFLLIVYKCIKRGHVAQDPQDLSENNEAVHHHEKTDTAAHEYHTDAARNIAYSMIGGNITLEKLLHIT